MKFIYLIIKGFIVTLFVMFVLVYMLAWCIFMSMVLHIPN
jgi:hypothetical protein